MKRPTRAGTRREKDESINRFLSRLESELGPCNYQVVDHWEADPCAIGIASAKDSRRLVYVCTYDQPPGSFYFECEIGGESTNKSDYDSTVSGEAADFFTLLAIIRGHLALQ